MLKRSVFAVKKIFAKKVKKNLVNRKKCCIFVKKLWNLIAP